MLCALCGYAEQVAYVLVSAALGLEFVDCLAAELGGAGGCFPGFLTSQGISPTNPSGKFRNAHERIDEWKGKDPSHPGVANLFYAVKWLGTPELTKTPT